MFGLGAIGAALISGSAKKSAQRSANRQNIALSRENREFMAEQAKINRQFQSAQAQKQMGFQERMASTEYQRATDDMREAGINPMLAITQGGASSPTGAAGAGAQAAGDRATVEPADPHLDVAVNTALQQLRLKKQVELMEAQKNKMNVETNIKRRKEPTSKIQESLGKDLHDFYKSLRNELGGFSSQDLKRKSKDQKNWDPTTGKKPWMPQPDQPQ